MTTPYHIPALLPQTLEALNISPNGTYVDVTYGGGGHSRAILERLGPDGRLIAMDRDIEALERAVDDPRLTTVHGDFRYVVNFLRFCGITQVDGLLADLGVSFHHFDDAQRGFSFREDAPLDMRMNRAGVRTAAQIVAEAAEEDLERMFKLYGDLPQARRIARAIVAARQQQPVDTTARLVEVVRPLIDPRKEKKELAQVFQALRMEVNDETAALRALLEGAGRVLRPGGRLAVITYHSIEDRLVKNYMRTGNFEGRRETDIYGRTDTPWRPVGSKPITADEQEVTANPRSRSAKLRVAEIMDKHGSCAPKASDK